MFSGQFFPQTLELALLDAASTAPGSGRGTPSGGTAAILHSQQRTVAVPGNSGPSKAVGGRAPVGDKEKALEVGGSG